MTVDSAELFFSLLAVMTLVGAVVVLAARLTARVVPPAATFVANLAPFGNALAAAVATTSMAGSLYFSESANFTPCTLCWYQRIAMYPLSLILAIAALRRDRSIRWYAVPVAAIGAAIALYHWLLERFPDLDTGVCSASIPCTSIWFERFGFVTLPFMALTAFVAVLLLVTLPRQDQPMTDPNTPT